MAPETWGPQPPRQGPAIPFVRRVRCPAPRRPRRRRPDHRDPPGARSSRPSSVRRSSRSTVAATRPSAANRSSVNRLIRDFVRSLDGAEVSATDHARRRLGDDGGRARLPDRSGCRDVDGRRPDRLRRLRRRRPTIVLLPSAPIVHCAPVEGAGPLPQPATTGSSTFDGRGNGRSDRPDDPEAYADDRIARDLAAVHGRDRHARAPCSWACASTASGDRSSSRRASPERVLGIVAFAVGVPYLTPPHPHWAAYSFEDELRPYEGWAQGQPALLAARLPRLRRSSSSSSACPSRTRPSRSRTSSAGRSTVASTR